MIKRLQNAVLAIASLVGAALLLGFGRMLYNRDHSVHSLVVLTLAFVVFQICAGIWTIAFKKLWDKWRNGG